MTQHTIDRESLSTVQWVNRGVYSVDEVAMLIGAKYATVSRWVFRGLAEDAISLTLGARSRTILDFHDLITMRVVQRLRDDGHSLQRIRGYHDDWVNDLRIAHPFATNRVFSDDRDIYIEDVDAPMSSRKLGQHVMLDVIREGLRDVTFDESTALASRWTPVEFVTIDPRVQYGAPCFTGTRVRIQVVAEMLEAGESLVTAASAYGLEPDAVAQAVSWHRPSLNAA